MQFDGRRQLLGVSEVLAILREFEPLTIAGWLAGPMVGEKESPVELLRAGQASRVLA